MRRIVLSLLLVASVAMAESFFGFSAGNMDTKIKTDSASSKIKDNDIDLKLGLLVPNDYRTYISLSLLSKGSSSSLGFEKTTLLFNYDEFSNVYNNYNYNVDYFIGMQFGLARADLSYNDGTTTTNSSGTMGFAYGLKTGLNLTISQEFSVEFGYKYNAIRLDDTINGREISLDNENGLFLGFNIIF